MQLDFEKFPRLLPNAKAAGTVTRQAAAETGLEEGTPVACGGNDLPAGAVGSGALHSGQAFYYSGTGSNATVLTDKLLHHVPRSPALPVHPRPEGEDAGRRAGVGRATPCAGSATCWAARSRAAAQMLGDPVSAFDMMDLEAAKTAPGPAGCSSCRSSSGISTRC